MTSAPPPPRVTRFDAYAAGLAAGEADRTAGLTEPREGVWQEAHGPISAYVIGYQHGFRSEDDEEEHLPPPPLLVDVTGAVVEAFLGAWAVGGSSRLSWRAVPAAAAYFAGQHLHMASRRRRKRTHPPEGPLPPVLLTPGLIARNQGFAFGWWLMRRHGELGNGPSTRLARNLLALLTMRVARRKDLRLWNEQRPR